jgi:hypothetical protein
LRSTLPATTTLLAANVAHEFLSLLALSKKTGSM